MPYVREMHIPSPVSFPPGEPTNLGERFCFTNSHTRYEIAWTAVGNPQGEPVVMIHGIPWSSRIWAPLATALAATGRYVVYLFDNPGYGASVAKSNDMHEEPDISPDAKAFAFAKLLELWKLHTPPHLIVHDRGGQIALRGHLLHGLKYKSLCMIDVVATNPLGAPFLTLIRDNPQVFQQLDPEIYEAMIRAWIRSATANGSAGLNPQSEDSLAAPWLDRLNGAQGQRGFIRQAMQTHANLTENLEARYGELKGVIPIKIIWGKQDVWLPPERAEKLAKLVGAEQVVLVENAGHLIQLEQPERLAVELSSWLASV